MKRATLTVLSDGQRRLHRLRRGDVVELSLVDFNVVDGADDSVVEFHRSGRRGFALSQRADGWDIGAHAYDGVVVDGVELEHHGRRLKSGDDIAVDGAVFRFDEATQPPLSRLVAGPGVVLYDVASVAGPVRAFGVNDQGVEVVVVVTWAAELARLQWRVHRGVRRGVPLLEVCARAGVVEEAVAVDAIARLSEQLIAADGEWMVDDDGVIHVDGEVGFDFARRPPWLGWDGELQTLPALWPRDVDNRLDAVQWWLRALFGRDVSPAAARMLASTSLQAFHDEAMRELHRLRRVDRAELASIARGLLPDEWRREQELADELVVVDAAGCAALRARALGKR